MSHCVATIWLGHFFMKVLGARTHYKSNEGKLRLSAVDYWRIDNPLSHVAKNTDIKVDFINKIVKDGVEPVTTWEKVGKGYDVFYSSYYSTPKPYAYLRAAGDLYNAKIVMDIDDNVFEVDEMAPAYVRFYPGSEPLKNITTIIRDVPILTTSTKYLAGVCAKYRQKPVYVMPNYIDPTVYRYDPRLIPDNEDKIIIGYQGSSTHYSDLISTGVLYALRRIVNEFDNVFVNIVGCIIDDFKLYLPKDRITFTSGATDHKQWRKVWQKLDFDIGIAPLLNSGFNRAKSSIKYYEYSLRKIPAVYSWIDPYLDVVKENETGFLAQDEEEWYEKIKWLVSNQVLRKKMGQVARDDVLNNYTIQRNWHKWETLLRS